MFDKTDKTKNPAKLGPVLVHENNSPDRSRTTYSTRAVFGSLCDALEKFETHGWEVHTVERRHSAPHGDFHWVLLRKPGQKSKLPLGGNNA